MGVSDVSAYRLVVMYAQDDELKSIVVDFDAKHEEVARDVANWGEQASGFWQSDEARQTLDQIRKANEADS